MSTTYSDCREYPGLAPDDPQYHAKRNFILQQGFEAFDDGVCPGRYAALLFQPRIVFAVLLIGLIFQSYAVFFVLGAILWWSALFPAIRPQTKTSMGWRASSSWWHFSS